MARKKNGADAPPPEHNSHVRQKIMREVAREIVRLKSEMAPIQAEITEQRGRIKSLGIKAKVFNIALSMAELEDAAERDADMDALRESFEALKIGGQLDWLSAVPGEDEDDGIDRGAPDPRGVDKSAPVGAAAAAGLKAGKAGKPKDTCPYPEGTPARASWNEAWQTAQNENLKDLGQGAQAH